MSVLSQHNLIHQNDIKKNYIQQNDILHNYTQQNDNQQNSTQIDLLQNDTHEKHIK